MAVGRKRSAHADIAARRILHFGLSTPARRNKMATSSFASLLFLFIYGLGWGFPSLLFSMSGLNSLLARTHGYAPKRDNQAAVTSRSLCVKETVATQRC